jgi:hydrogenase nickel incorporation protein HypA/HybF
MHELAVTESILEIALKHARAANAGRITQLNLVVGKLASIVDDSVQFYWDIISKDTPAAGARLVFRRIPGRMQCQACNAEFPVDGHSYACPHCGSNGVKVIAGNEFFLESIDVDEEESSVHE